MKRKILALVLVVCCAGLGYRYWRPIWFALAYSSSTTLSHSRSTHELLLYRQRADWLPGPGVWFPSQTCASCLDESHLMCLQLFIRRLERLGREEPVTIYGDMQVHMSWRCACETCLRRNH